ncbi:MAG: TolC family protein [Phycisphaerae bacterium]
MALLAAALAGCALNHQGDREISEMLQRYERNRQADSAAYATLPTTTTQPALLRPETPTAEGTEPLSELIRLALERNPDIEAAIDTARSKASRVPQATALPDPLFSTKTFPEPVRTAEGDNFFVLGIRQRVPVPEKLDRRGRVALEEARMAIEQVEQTRLRVIADVKRTYFRIYTIDKSIQITRENKRLLRDLIDVTRAQVEVGMRPQEDVLRAQVEHSNLERELIEFRQQRETVVALLNALLDRPTTTTVATPPDYDARRVDLHLDRLFDQALAQNPILRRLQRQIARDEEGVRLARLAYWPDFTIGFEWMQMDPRAAFRPRVNPQTGVRPRVSQLSKDGSDNWGITFGFNIPLWYQKIEAGIREAQHQSSASRRRYVSAKNTLLARVNDGLARVNAERDVAELYSTTIIPQAKQAYEVSRVGYVAGSSTFEFVIDNWQKWLQFRILYYRTLAQLEQSVADLEQAVGVSIVEAAAGPTRE